MKKIVLGLLMAVSFYSNAQEYKLEEKSVTGIFEANGKTKAELFSAINKWISVNYKSANSVIQLNDAEAGTIVIKGNANYPIRCIFKPLLPKSFQEGSLFDNFSYAFSHSIQIDIKDNKFRVKYAIIDCIDKDSFDINTSEVTKSINFSDHNNVSVDYNGFADSYMKAYYIVASKKNREKFNALLKPFFEEVNVVLEREIKATMDSINSSIKLAENDKW
jgi:hypothetical protein